MSPNAPETFDNLSEGCVYAKLPRAFSIPPWVGSHNADWVIAFNRGQVKLVFFIAEAKGSLSTLEPKKIGSAKIDCSHKFSSENTCETTRYDVVESYDELMVLVR